jgi:alanine dehydrogenase
MLPLCVALAEKGGRKALAEDAHLRNGLNVHAGRITHAAVARDLGLEYLAPDQAIAA